MLHCSASLPSIPFIPVFRGHDLGRFAIQGLKSVAGKSGWAQLMLNFPTADDFLDEVNYVVSSLLPLSLPQVAAALRKGFVELFDAYTGAVALAFAKHKSDGRLPESLGTPSAAVSVFLPG